MPNNIFVMMYKLVYTWAAQEHLWVSCYPDDNPDDNFFCVSASNGYAMYITPEPYTEHTSDVYWDIEDDDGTELCSGSKCGFNMTGELDQNGVDMAVRRVFDDMIKPAWHTWTKPDAPSASAQFIRDCRNAGIREYPPEQLAAENAEHDRFARHEQTVRILDELSKNVNPALTLDNPLIRDDDDF